MGKFLDAYPVLFHQRWGTLRDPDVRALAWLLDAPDILDVAAPIWQEQIASLSEALNGPVVDWLNALDQAPNELHQFLKQTPITRLGKYSERLLSFFLNAWREHVSSSVQIRSKEQGTLGEFDFVFRQDQSLVHWELATKIYLYKPVSEGGDVDILDQFVGPGQSDTLGTKLKKILTYQLHLKEYPEAQDYFSEPIVAAQALVKGWLFYQEETVPPVVGGIAASHCAGFWCRLSQWHIETEVRYVILARLQWLAPIRTLEQDTLSGQAVRNNLSAYFMQGGRPILIAVLVSDVQGEMKEIKRGFIVPDDW